MVLFEEVLVFFCCKLSMDTKGTNKSEFASKTLCVFTAALNLSALIVDAHPLLHHSTQSKTVINLSAFIGRDGNNKEQSSLLFKVSCVHPNNNFRRYF